MRQQIITRGARELKYEIRSIVKKAHQIQSTGTRIHWENIGDPIQKSAQIPQWMKETIKELLDHDETYGYCDSKGVPETREFLAKENNKRGGVQITAEDILFFNGLGDAISKIYQFILPTSRVIGPSPSYSTHSSSEAAHASHEPITYNLDPSNYWYPDLDDLYNKVKYNSSIVAILIINPDNPTGMVYPRETLKRIVEIAREFGLFLISDEIYMNITFNGVEYVSLSEVVEEIPAISLKGISKELPWPGARCGWAEFYNRTVDSEFDKLCKALEDAKMVEVCATKLPQLVIPKIMTTTRYQEFREMANQKIAARSQRMAEHLANVDGVFFNRTNGAFYNSVIFKEGALKAHQTLEIKNKDALQVLRGWKEAKPVELDRRFVYYLLASTGICVVPISSFCSDLNGFRVTLLEENEEEFDYIFKTLATSINSYLSS
jgi:aspartate/methionine/tyrosine aminotransferase